MSDNARPFDEFAAEKKAEWDEDARAVYDAATEAFANELTVGDDGMTDAERASESALSQVNQGPSERSRRLFEQWRSQRENPDGN